MKISIQNNLRYNIDTLDTLHYGVFISNNYAVDCSEAASISKLNFSSSIPAGCGVFLLFFVNNSWAKLTPEGNLAFIDNNTHFIDFQTLKTYGNSLSELEALSDIPGLAGKKFGFAAGLFSADPDNALPAFKFYVTCKNNTQVLKTSKISPVYNLAGTQIISASPAISVTGGASCSVSAQYSDKNGNLSDWVNLDTLQGKQINSVQFKADYSVPDTNTALADLTALKLIYSKNNYVFSGASTTEIISVSEDWHMNIKSCRMNIKHSPLINSKIKAFLSLRKSPTSVFSEKLGIGNGKLKTFQLIHTDNINYDSVRLYFDNVLQYSEYEINSEAGRISCIAPEGVIITADYDYGFDYEVWREMSLASQFAFENYDASEFRIELPDNNYSIAAVKIQLITSAGFIQDEKLGTANGVNQTFRLQKLVDDGNITVYANNRALNQKYYSLHDDTQYITVTAPAGQIISASYSWVSETPEIYQFAAVLSK